MSTDQKTRLFRFVIKTENDRFFLVSQVVNGDSEIVSRLYSVSSIATPVLLLDEIYKVNCRVGQKLIFFGKDQEKIVVPEAMDDIVVAELYQ